MKFSIKDFFSKCDQIRGTLRIWSHLLKKSLMENFIFYAVRIETSQLICTANQLTSFYIQQHWFFNPFQSSVAFNVEPSLLTSNANQMTGFYIKCNNGLKWAKHININ